MRDWRILRFVLRFASWSTLVSGRGGKVFQFYGLVRPEDLTATIFHCLGYTPETEMHDLQGRVLAISRGEVLRPTLA